MLCFGQNITEKQRELWWLLQSTAKKGRGDEKQPDEMRDRAVKYLWSTPKEMLWGRRNQQKNRKWESGSMLWFCACVTGMVFVFFHTVISLGKRCQEQSGSPIRDELRNPVQSTDRLCHPALPLQRSNNSTRQFLKQNNAALCYASDLLHTLCSRPSPFPLGANNHTLKPVILLALCPA